MQATLIFNRNAGGSDALDLEEALDAMRLAGYEPVYRPTNSEEDLDAALAHADGLIVAAGGDGTLRAVITRLVGRERPLAVVPLGTANNVGGALRLDDEPLNLIKRLAEPRRLTYDLGRIQGPWGTNYFLEGAGFGFFADMLHNYQPKKGKSILRGLEAFGDTLDEDYAISGRLWIDDEHYSENYLLVEILNTKAVGPRLKFAPDADPTDGLLDVVRIRKDSREGFLEYMLNIVDGELDELESVAVSQARQIKFAWTGFGIHIDAELWPPEAREDRASGKDGIRAFNIQAPEDQMITIDVLPGAIELWLPAPKEERKGGAVAP
ncbi:MAG TPA: diacylglycerol kinase family protein [Candidatus Binatia bacterium]|nr:diacylglycerol kinase family protein [Candidatus Binatia bacterium]